MLLSAPLAWLLLSPPPSAPQESTAEIETLFAAARRAREECRWEEVAESWRELRSLIRRGDEDWYFAGTQLAGALHEIWTEPAQDELVSVARETLAAVAQWQRARPGQGPETRGADGSLLAGHLLVLRSRLADTLQGRGLYAEALGHLQLAIGDLERGHAAHREELLPQMEWARAHCLLQLGRHAQAQEVLSRLRDGHPRAPAGARAAVLLAPRDGYRGTFAADPRFQVRSRELLQHLPDARRRIAAWLGRGLRDLPAVEVGFADSPSGIENIYAFTQYEPRQRGIPPVVVFSSHQVALGLFDFEKLLVHELSHAVLWSELGRRYQSVPNWIQEGLARSLSGELEGLVDTVLAGWLVSDAEQFLRSLSEVRCLLASSDPEQARAHLERLLREGLRAETRAWAATRLAELPSAETGSNDRSRRSPR